ncbi:hypothetical protein SAMN04488128_1011148 [Chitinophaga eiseniae]|uniref:DUF4325 domain-containing protein n=1 Tax=Chitinophaga eiseniae TaxID=634771 RepID=A0A1T4MKV0_9BACT|nr:DUF4325 domain-containing protein [Chitinophaga eiseniae]SJZ67573.1 hypothetical protein SAMN04488128_1011148 [Chitinophaga eiseniae]
MNTTLQMSELLSKNYALTQEDALAMYSPALPIIQNHEEITISFKGMETCSTMFFRYFLGRLFSEFGNQVSELIHFEGIENDSIRNQLDLYLERVLGDETYKAIYLNHI